MRASNKSAHGTRHRHLPALAARNNCREKADVRAPVPRQRSTTSSGTPVYAAASSRASSSASGARSSVVIGLPQPRARHAAARGRPWSGTSGPRGQGAAAPVATSANCAISLAAAQCTSSTTSNNGDPTPVPVTAAERVCGRAPGRVVHRGLVRPPLRIARHRPRRRDADRSCNESGVGRAFDRSRPIATGRLRLPA